MKKYLIAAALVLVPTAAFAAVQGAMSCCEDCCDEMRSHGEHGRASAPAAPQAPRR